MTYPIKIVSCLPEPSRQALTVEAERSEFVYDSDPRITPQRIFRWGPNKENWGQDGRGYPMIDSFDLSTLERTPVAAFNCEYFGPDFHGMPLAMQAKGLEIHHTREYAERAAAEYIRARLAGIKAHTGGLVGAYNGYPNPGMSAIRAYSLQDVDIWMPSIYVNANGYIPNVTIDYSLMPPKPVVPVVRLDANNGEMLGQSSWTATFYWAMRHKATMMYLWGDENDPAHANLASQFMVNGAKVAGVSLTMKQPDLFDPDKAVEDA